MNRKLFYIILTVLLALLLSIGGATAQEPGPEGKAEPQGEVTIAAVVNSRIGYQGILKESGSPVTGSRDMTFRLYSDDTCTTQEGADIVKNGVSVADGLFSVELDVDHKDFNGQGLWLEVEVGGAQIGCQEILPVPYALSLRPGARIYANSTGSGLEVDNDGTGDGIAAYARATDENYAAVFAGNYGTGTGVLGLSSLGYAGYFLGTGDVAQSRTGDGLVKAAVYAYCHSMNSIFYRSFNHAGGTNSIVNGPSNGRCTIDFGFQIDDRFWSATAVSSSARGVSCILGSSNAKLDCLRWAADILGAGAGGPIIVSVY